jgi:diguanylate cyclase (GGDEF)-like protein
MSYQKKIPWPLSLIRRIHNTFGHEAGDIALQDLGNFLQINVRKEDVACRF